MSISFALATILLAVPITFTVCPALVSPVPATLKNPVRSVSNANVDVPPGIVWVFNVPLRSALTLMFTSPSLASFNEM